VGINGKTEIDYNLKLLRPVIHFCRHLGISVVAYLDDFLWADDHRTIDQLVTFVRKLMSLLGFAVSDKKSEWTPTQSLQFLGLLVNTEAYEFGVPHDKVTRIITRVTDLLAAIERGARIPVKQLATVCGHLISCRLAIAPARIYTRALYAMVNQAAHWNERMHLSAAAMEELKFWKSELPNFTSLGMIPAGFTTRLFCDASDDGWGAHCHNASAFGYFEPDDCAPHTSSTYRELLGLLYAIQSPNIAYNISGQKVMFTLDSSAAVHNLLKGGGPKPDLSRLVKAVWKECVSLNSDAGAEWISRNKNEYADFLSKYRDRADWRLHRSVFEYLDTLWGPHTIDRFAASHNTHCDRFNSRYTDPGAEAIDAFRQNWSGENNYCNPDFNDIARVVEHARRHRADITLVFPGWKAQSWYGPLIASAFAIVALPEFHDTFSPGPRSSASAIHAPNWPVFAARLCFDV